MLCNNKSEPPDESVGFKMFERANERIPRRGDVWRLTTSAMLYRTYKLSIYKYSEQWH